MCRLSSILHAPELPLAVYVFLHDVYGVLDVGVAADPDDEKHDVFLLNTDPDDTNEACLLIAGPDDTNDAFLLNTDPDDTNEELKLVGQLLSQLSDAAEA